MKDEDTKASMTELRYFVSDNGVAGRNEEAEEDFEAQDECDDGLFPLQPFIGGCSRHSGNNRFSLLSIASSVTMDLSDREDDEEDDLFCDFNIVGPSLDRSTTADSMPALPLRRVSCLPEDATPKIPGRRISVMTTLTVGEAKTVLKSEARRKGSFVRTSPQKGTVLQPKMRQKDTSDCVQYTVTSTGA